ncbi:MAG: VOC family protein, partial [Candidatus Rokuibacteriota bacterium]
MQVRSMYHTGFTVSDIERSIAFYRDALGLTLVRQQEGTAEYLSAVTGFTDVRLKIALLKAPDGTGMLELLEYVSHPASPTERETNRPGNGHLCFKVDDIHEACDELSRRGVRLISEPAE